MTARLTIRFALTLLVGLLIWLGWPIYGFLSNQYETARLPLGWTEIAESPPRSQILPNAEFQFAGEIMLESLDARRALIGAPSLSAAIAIDGELVWAGAVGWADVKASRAATPDTPYRIGSTSKAVTATLLARLVTLGELDLETPISNYVANLPNVEWETLTLRQLLSHTAGLPAYEENRDWVGFYQSLALQTHFESATDALSVVDGSPQLNEAGRSFHYSGYGTVLASAVIEAKTSQSFTDALTSYVANPLGAESVVATPVRPKSPHAVSYQSKGTRVKPWRHVDLSHKIAAGGFSATPSDLASIGSAWLDDTFISPEIRQQFWTPVALSDGTANPQDYALGWRVKSWPIKGVGDVAHVNHGGVSKGSQAWLMIAPEHKTVLAITTNRRTEVFFDFADIYVDLFEVALPLAGQANASADDTPPSPYSIPSKPQ